MGIQRRTTAPAGIVNESGQPEIVLEIEGLTLAATPPPKVEPPVAPKQDGDPDGPRTPVV
jgi:hypothetical protein